MSQFTTVSIESLQYQHDRLLSVVDEIARTQRISQESVSFVHHLPVDLITQQARYTLSQESLTGSIKAGIRRLVEAILKLWRRICDWAVNAFSSKRKQAEDIHEQAKKFDDFMDQMKEENDNFTDHMRARGEDHARQAKEAFDEHIRKGQEAAAKARAPKPQLAAPELSQVASALTDDMVQNGGAVKAMQVIYAMVPKVVNHLAETLKEVEQQVNSPGSKVFFANDDILSEDMERVARAANITSNRTPSELIEAFNDYLRKRANAPARHGLQMAEAKSKDYSKLFSQSAEFTLKHDEIAKQLRNIGDKTTDLEKRFQHYLDTATEEQLKGNSWGNSAIKLNMQRVRDQLVVLQRALTAVFFVQEVEHKVIAKLNQLAGSYR